MPNILAALTLNQRLALLAFLLGLGALAATPTTGERLTVDARQMAWLAANGSSRVPARTLADWIVQGRADYQLVDVRSADAFAAGPRIPSAENIPLTVLFDAGLDRDQTIVLVGEDEAAAAQAWFLLQAAGYRGAAIVDGGLAAWRDQVLYPRVDGVDAAARAKLEAVSAHFGGAPRIGGGADPPVAAPASGLAQASPAVPKLPAAGAKKPSPAKKREGC